MITNTELEYKGDLFPSKCISYSKQVNILDFKSDNDVLLRVTVLRDSVLRIRYGTDGYFDEDFSYAINEDANIGYNHLEVKEENDKYVIQTSKLICHVMKQDLRISILDINEQVILQDELGFHWEESYEWGGNIVKMSKVAQDAESFYGLGDKATHFNLKGRRLHNWVTDQYAYAKDQDPLYKAVPFYVGLHSNIAYGVFFDNTFKTFFDFGHERRNITSFWAEGGEMNYYFIYGPEMSDVVVSYTDLTGKPELPPLWALGYHQSKWSYYPEKRVKEIARSFRKYKIPCDAIYLDIDYMDGFRCFTWDKSRFPNPAKMVSDLEKDGFKTVAMIDPGIKIDKDYFVYQQAMENDYFCKRADGPYAKGKVWPGECHFPDFTNPEVRAWWGNLYKEMIADFGIKGIWNDMNEPAVMEVPTKTLALDVRHDYDGHRCSHRKAHNIYGMQMIRATYDGIKKYTYPKRPFVLTRAAYAGTQRFSSTWTGDNVATWEHLWLANIQMQRLSISGMSFSGSDIGGFAEQPTGELFVRWMQLAIFHPFCRTHSSGDHGEQEPWSFGDEATDIVRKYIELRYRLLPYLYTAFWKYSEEAAPMLKPLVLYDQEDTQTHYRTDEFIFGDQILVCPILEPNAMGRRMYIPRGNWYNFWADELISGGKEIWVVAEFDKIPIFIKEGAIIPFYPVQQYVGEKKIERLELDVYYKKGREQSIVYEDAGDGYDYKKGRFSLRNFNLLGKSNALIIQQHMSGKFETSYETFKIKLHGLPFKIDRVEVDNEIIAFSDIKLNGDNTMEIKKNFTELHIIGK